MRAGERPSSSRIWRCSSRISASDMPRRTSSFSRETSCRRASASVEGEPAGRGVVEDRADGPAAAEKGCEGAVAVFRGKTPRVGAGKPVGRAPTKGDGLEGPCAEGGAGGTAFLPTVRSLIPLTTAAWANRSPAEVAKGSGPPSALPSCSGPLPSRSSSKRCAASFSRCRAKRDFGFAAGPCGLTAGVAGEEVDATGSSSTSFGAMTGMGAVKGSVSAPVALDRSLRVRTRQSSRRRSSEPDRRRFRSAHSRSWHGVRFELGKRWLIILAREIRQ